MARKRVEVDNKTSRISHEDGPGQEIIPEMIGDKVNTKKRRPRAVVDDKKKAEVKELVEANPNLTHSQVAELVSLERSTVTRMIAGFEIDKKAVDEFVENRADIYASLGRRLLLSITDEDIKRTSAAQRVTMAAIVHDKERLERGQSTSNVLTIDVLAKDVLGSRKSDTEPSQSDV